VQARSGKLPSPAELERLAASHPAPPSMGEVAVDERTIEELIIALAHLTARAAKVRAGQALGSWNGPPQAALQRLGGVRLVAAHSGVRSASTFCPPHCVQFGHPIGTAAHPLAGSASGHRWAAR
jgi:hypothetical protein